uniref:ORF1; putative n=1 Tax=Streptomyces violaceoruber TaxID=1935 RepID=Q56172_STRVN|nr:ORF1; putative [Streptomyces violaceoruber]
MLCDSGIGLSPFVILHLHLHHGTEFTMPALRSRTRTAAIAVPLALAGLMATTSGAQAAPVKTYFDCRVGTVTGLAYSTYVDGVAPAHVRPGATFDVTLDPAPITPNPAYNKEVKNVALQFKLPAGAKVLSYEVADRLAAGTPELQIDGTKAVLRAAGPYVANAPFDLPKITIKLKAPTTRGTLETPFGGTSHDDPGFTWTFISPNWTARPSSPAGPTSRSR